MFVLRAFTSGSLWVVVWVTPLLREPAGAILRGQRALQERAGRGSQATRPAPSLCALPLAARSAQTLFCRFLPSSLPSLVWVPPPQGGLPGCSHMPCFPSFSPCFISSVPALLPELSWPLLSSRIWALQQQEPFSLLSAQISGESRAGACGRSPGRCL